MNDVLAVFKKEENEEKLAAAAAKEAAENGDEDFVVEYVKPEHPLPPGLTAEMVKNLGLDEIEIAMMGKVKTLIATPTHTLTYPLIHACVLEHNHLFTFLTHR